MEPTLKIKPRSEKNCEKLFDTCLTKLRQSLFLGILFLTAISFAIPSDLQNYDVLSGGMTDILDGAIVEGSSRYQGLQPDYQIDLESEPLRSFMKRAENIGAMKASFWIKVGIVVHMVGSDFFNNKDYSNPQYRELMRQYRSVGKTIPLSQYGVCQAGVCREHALVLHFALKAAGIPNTHVYAKVYQEFSGQNPGRIEDHAFVVVKKNGTNWVIDAYNSNFNGFKLKDLTSRTGIRDPKDHNKTTFSELNIETRRIIEINDYPKIYNPKSIPLLCGQSLI